MEILVLGGTGAMGVSLVEILATRGDEVYVTSRQKRKDSGNVHYWCGDAHDMKWLKSKTAGYEFAAIVDFMFYDLETFRANYRCLLAMTKHYVFLSSSRVYCDSPDKPITETTPRLLDVSRDADFLATEEYALTKAREEDILRQTFNGNYTIIRPYVTYNDERLQLGILEKEAWLYRALRGRTIVFTADIAACMTTLTHGRDVAEGIAAIIGKEAAYGEAFHIVGAKSMKWQEVLEVYLDTLEQITGTRPKVKLLANSGKFSHAFGNPYAIWYDRLYNRVFDSTKIRCISGKSTYIGMREGLVKCLKSFIAKGAPFREKNIDWRLQAWMDRKTNEYSSITDIPSQKH